MGFRVTPDLTAADLARIERRHERKEDWYEENGGMRRLDIHCGEDGQDWPCDTLRLVAAVRELARAVVEANTDFGCPFCAATLRDGIALEHEPACPVLRARALLGEDTSDDE